MELAMIDILTITTTFQFVHYYVIDKKIINCSRVRDHVACVTITHLV